MTYCHVTHQLDQHDRKESLRETLEANAECAAAFSHDLLINAVKATNDPVLINWLESRLDDHGIELHEAHLENFTLAAGIDDDYADFLEAM